MSEFRAEGVPGAKLDRDPAQRQARVQLIAFFEEHRDGVFFSRQLEVRFEDQFFHWITNRAIGDLVRQGAVRMEARDLADGGTIHVLWHRSNRYHRRQANRLVRLVDEYSAPNIGASLGRHGELLVLEAFARGRFLMEGQEVRTHGWLRWTKTDHDLDFVFARDGVAYGVEVKNTPGYMDHDELDIKMSMCRRLRVQPVFVVRMLPKEWIWEVYQHRGFALILKWQLYPWTHRDLARRVQRELGLPVDSPKRLADGTMARFIRWHGKQRP